MKGGRVVSYEVSTYSTESRWTKMSGIALCVFVAYSICCDLMGKARPVKVEPVQWACMATGPSQYVCEAR